MGMIAFDEDVLADGNDDGDVQCAALQCYAELRASIPQNSQEMATELF